MGDFEYNKNQKLGATDQVVSPLADIIQRNFDKMWQFMLLACDGIWDEFTNGKAVDFVSKFHPNRPNRLKVTAV